MRINYEKKSLSYQISSFISCRDPTVTVVTDHDTKRGDPVTPRTITSVIRTWTKNNRSKTGYEASKKSQTKQITQGTQNKTKSRILCWLWKMMTCKGVIWGNNDKI